MAFFKKGSRRRRVLVLSIDGVPHSFLQSQMAQGRLPNLSGMVQGGTFARMRSVLPTISSVAWSTYMTGKNPAKHGIFGFVDHKPNSYEVFIPTSLNMTSKTLWEILGQSGKEVVVINVPVTYPPRPVNGILVSGFLASNLKKAAYPEDVGQQLEQMGYRIDADAALAHQSLDRFLEDLHHTLEKRIQTMYFFLDKQPWDYFHLHVMGTDRINHFLWEHMEREDPRYGRAFLDYYERIDEILGNLNGKLGDDVTFVVMSDHGFCSVKREVNLSRFLIDKGWLSFEQTPPRGLGDIHPSSIAYSLIPGRIYLNLKDREPKGSVNPSDYEKVRKEVSEELLGLRDPESGKQVIQKVVPREEIYSGDNLPLAADLIAVPFDGFDLKADIRKNTIAEKTAIEGMHTYDDAFLYMRGQPSVQEGFEIMDLMPTILSIMDVPVPEDVDGRSLV